MQSNSTSEQPEGGASDATCPILLCIQPYYDRVMDAATPKGDDDWIFGKPGVAQRQLVFLVWWLDPVYQLSHHTTSQSVPEWWRAS